MCACVCDGGGGLHARGTGIGWEKVGENEYTGGNVEHFTIQIV